MLNFNKRCYLYKLNNYKEFVRLRENGEKWHRRGKVPKIIAAVYKLL